MIQQVVSDGGEEVPEGYKQVKLGPKPIQIPEEWNHVYFSDAIEFNPRYDKPDSGTFDFVPMDAVSEEEQRITYFTEREKDDCTTTWFKNKDTIYAKITPCAENGKIAYVEKVDTDLASGSTEFVVFHPKGGKTDSRFVFYLSNMPQFRSVTISLMEGSTNRQRIPNDIFEGNLRIPLPSLSEQRGIAEILSTVDKEIQETGEVIKKKEELRQGLIQNLYRYGAKDHGEHSEIQSLEAIDGGVNTSLDQTTIGKIPTDWDTKRLGDLTVESKYGVNESAEEYNPTKPRYIRITDIADDGHLKDNDLKSLTREKAENYVLESGDLLFARTGATVGKTFLYNSQHPEAVYAGYLIRFKLDTEQVLPEFVFYFTQSSNYVRWVKRITRQGAQENINTGEYSSILLPLPSLDEQRQIVNIIQSSNQRIQQERQQKQKLQELKRGLMQDLLTGKVRVDDINLDNLNQGEASTDG